MTYFKNRTTVKMLLKITALFAGVFFATGAFGANYPLEIIAPQEGLDTHSRWYKAYPGIEYKVPVGVFGGMYPFTYELTNAPSGMSIDPSTGIITWSNPTRDGSPHQVTVQVRDAENSTDRHSWTITVTTAGFVFIDADAPDGGDGSISSPLNSIGNDILGPNGEITRWNDYFLYFRGGTYGLDEGYFSGSCGDQQYNVGWRPGDRHPHVWLEYPGETAIIDHDFATDSCGAYIRDANSDTDIFFHGIKFQDMRNHAVRMGEANRSTFFECELTNGGPSQDGANTSYIMYTGTGTGMHDYVFLKDNTLSAGSFSYIKTYGMVKSVIEGNSFSISESGGNGIALKAYDRYISVRANTFDGDWTYGAIGGNWNDAGHFDISFNKIINADTSHTSVGDDGALTMNYHGTQAAPVHVYRNTFEGTVLLRRCSSGDIYLDNNVIINGDAGIVEDDGSGCTMLRIGDIGSNLFGTPADNIIDANGDLTASYSDYVGTKGYQIVGGSSGSLSLIPPQYLQVE